MEKIYLFLKQYGNNYRADQQDIAGFSFKKVS